MTYTVRVSGKVKMMSAIVPSLPFNKDGQEGSHQRRQECRRQEIEFSNELSAVKKQLHFMTNTTQKKLQHKHVIKYYNNLSKQMNPTNPPPLIARNSEERSICGNVCRSIDRGDFRRKTSTI